MSTGTQNWCADNSWQLVYAVILTHWTLVTETLWNIFDWSFRFSRWRFFEKLTSNNFPSENKFSAVWYSFIFWFGIFWELCINILFLSWYFQTIILHCKENKTYLTMRAFECVTFFDNIKCITTTAYKNSSW